MTTKLISITEIATRYGYQYNSVKKWIHEGMPFNQEKNKAPDKEATEWIVKNKIEPLREVTLSETMQREKLREQKAKADLAQYAAQEKSQELIPVSLVQQTLNEYCQKFKDTIRLVPSKSSVEILESATDVGSVKAKLREVLNEALEEIGSIMIAENIELENLADSDEQDENEQDAELETEQETEQELSSEIELS